MPEYEVADSGIVTHYPNPELAALDFPAPHFERGNFSPFPRIIISDSKVRLRRIANPFWLWTIFMIVFGISVACLEYLMSDKPNHDNHIVWLCLSLWLGYRALFYLSVNKDLVTIDLQKDELTNSNSSFRCSLKDIECFYIHQDDVLFTSKWGSSKVSLSELAVMVRNYRGESNLLLATFASSHVKSVQVFSEFLAHIALRGYPVKCIRIDWHAGTWNELQIPAHW